MTNNNNNNTPQPIKNNVLDYDDICKIAPFFKGKEKLVNTLFRWLKIDTTNDYHSRNVMFPPQKFCENIFDELNAKSVSSNEQVLDNLPEGPFITGSNHP